MPEAEPPLSYLLEAEPFFFLAELAFVLWVEVELAFVFFFFLAGLAFVLWAEVVSAFFFLFLAELITAPAPPALLLTRNPSTKKHK